MNTQKERYRICTETIIKSLDAAFDGGIALIEVKDHKLYKDDFETFEEYCGEVLKISARRAYQLIEAATIKEALPERASSKIINEAQARALAPVPEKDRPKVISEASKNGPITAASIEDAAGKMCNFLHKEKPIESNGSTKTSLKNVTPKPEAELDETGFKIPADAVPFWKRRQEIQDILTQVSKIKSLIEKSKAEEDPMFSKVSNAAIANLSQAYQHISEAKPYAVCTTCQGSPSAQPKGCEYCGNTGMVSKYRWDTASRKEVKDMRAKIVANAGRK